MKLSEPRGPPIGQQGYGQDFSVLSIGQIEEENLNPARSQKSLNGLTSNLQTLQGDNYLCIFNNLKPPLSLINILFVLIL